MTAKTKRSSSSQFESGIRLELGRVPEFNAGLNFWAKRIFSVRLSWRFERIEIDNQLGR